MLNLNLTDALTFGADAKVSQDAKLERLSAGFSKIGDLRLDEVPIEQKTLQLSFEQPIAIGNSGLKLTLGATSGGTLRVVTHGQEVLDDDDPFSTTQVNEGEIYVGLTLNCSLQGGISGAAGSITFGMSAEKEFSVTCYQLFQRGGSGFPTVFESLRDALTSFRIPQGVSDLEKLDSNSILVMAGTGTLIVSGGFAVSTPVDTIASLALPAGQTAELNASGAFKVKAKLTLTGGYQVRLRTPASRVLELGVYKLKSRGVELRASASIGLPATVGSFDLTEQFIGALSRQPALDIEEFKRALPGETPEARAKQIRSFEKSLDDAISTELSVAVQSTVSATHSDEAVWMFEIDLGQAMSPAVAEAFTPAFRGDFAELTKDPAALPPGIRQKQNVLTTTQAKAVKLTVNLLGLLNYLSVTKIARVSTVEYSEKGEITLMTDTSSAKRLEAVLLNAGLDAKRLRKLLSETFLVEASYHLSNLRLLPPDFRSRHTYLEVHASTNLQTLKDNLDVVQALGLISAEEASQRLSAKDFGRTTFYAEAQYKTDALRTVFFDKDGHPRAVSDYEQVGRQALASLLGGDAGQEFRQRLATDDGLWSRLKTIGNTVNFGPEFGLPSGVNDTRVAAAGSDYFAITSWASAMNGTAAAVRQVLDLIGGGGLPASDARWEKARDTLKHQMADLVKNTREEFGDPLGLLMVYFASNRTGTVRIILGGDHFETLDTGSGTPLTSTARS